MHDRIQKSLSADDSKILDATMEAAVDAIIVADESGQILRANTAAHRCFGYDDGELRGQNVRILMPQAMAHQHDGFMQDYLETGTQKIIGIGRRVEGQRKNGDVLPLHLSIGDTWTDGKRLFVAILHELTDRLAGEKVLARAMRLDAVRQMAAGITHDLNNLLTVIIGNLELAQLQSPDDKALRYVDNAMEAAELGAGLTARLLIFARQGSLQPEPCDLGVLCRKSIKMVRQTMGPSYEVTTDCPPELSLVMIDPVQLESAVINLAVNARDAMPDGGHLLIRTEEIVIDDAYMAQEADVKPGHYIRLMISDDGSGMTAEEQERAFEPFFTTKEDRNGTGLGLAMVYGFVHQSGGHVTLYSEVGLGTSIGLYFPALPRDGAIPDDAAANDVTLATGSGERILLVEDNPKVRKISADRLRALNYEVLTADDGDAAWQMLEAGAKVDLVFSDVVMPGTLSGYDLGSRVQEKYPEIKVLLTSGYASDIITGAMPSLDAFDILHKPFHQGALATRLSRLLGRSSA